MVECPFVSSSYRSFNKTSPFFINPFSSLSHSRKSHRECVLSCILHFIWPLGFASDGHSFTFIKILLYYSWGWRKRGSEKKSYLQSFLFKILIFLAPITEIICPSHSHCGEGCWLPKLAENGFVGTELFFWRFCFVIIW